MNRKGKVNLCYTKPYLVSLEPNKDMNVVWLTKSALRGTVLYGNSPNILDHTVEALLFTVDGLYAPISSDGYDDIREQNIPLSIYQLIGKIEYSFDSDRIYYQTISEYEGIVEKSQVYSFSRPQKGKSSKFLLLSDLQQLHPCEITVAMAGKEELDFLLFAGDMTMRSWEASLWFEIECGYSRANERGIEFFSVMSCEQGGCRLMQYLPIFPCPGNHDMDNYELAGTNKDTVDAESSWIWEIYMQLFRPLYPEMETQCIGKHWYSADYGDIHIVSLNVSRWCAWGAYEYPGWICSHDSIEPDSPQIKWLKEDLAKAATRYKWVIMHWHMMNMVEDALIPYSNPIIGPNGEVSYSDENYCESVLRPLFEKYRVSGVSFGHSHIYERYKVRGVNYIEAAHLGICYRPLGPEYAPAHPSGFIPDIADDRFCSYMVVSAGIDGMTARGVQASESVDCTGHIGRIFDEFEL